MSHRINGGAIAYRTRRVSIIPLYLLNRVEERTGIDQDVDLFAGHIGRHDGCGGKRVTVLGN